MHTCTYTPRGCLGTATSSSGQRSQHQPDRAHEAFEWCSGLHGVSFGDGAVLGVELWCSLSSRAHSNSEYSVILYINAPVCIHFSEKEYCTSVSPVPPVKVLKGVMGPPATLATGGSEDVPCVTRVCAGQTSSCSKDRKSFQHNLFGVTSRKLFPTLGFSHRVSGHPSSPLGGSGAPASQSCWSPVCRLCVSMVCTLWDQTLAQTLASRCKHWLSISLLFWFLSLCLLLIYFSVFHFSQFCFALLIYINRLSFAPLN